MARGLDSPLPLHLGERAVDIRRLELGLLALAIAFVGVNAISYSLVESGRVQWRYLWSPAVWTAVVLATHLLLSRFIPLRDPLLLPIAAILAGWGLVLVDRLAPAFLLRQTLWVVIGAIALTAIALLPKGRPGDPTGLRWLRRYRYLWLFLGMLTLSLTLVFGVNPSGAGPRLWLGGRLPVIGRVYFQPSELLKLLFIVYLASYMAEKEGLVHIVVFRLGRLRIARPPFGYLAPLLLMWGVSMILLAWQRDLGAAMLFFIVFLVMLYLASGRWEAVASGLVMLLATASLAYRLPFDTLDIVRLRIDTWINPWPDAQGRAFQIVQSLLALAAGGLIGQGVGQGYPTYIPVVHSDFAFAAVTEEWGLVGAVTVIISLAVLVHRGLRIAVLSRRPFISFLATGMVAFIGVQSLIILAGVTKLFPLSGITLPFLSYGGSSMVVSCLMVGLLIKISGRMMDTVLP